MGTLGDGEDMSSREFIFESYVMPKKKRFNGELWFKPTRS